MCLCDITVILALQKVWNVLPVSNLCSFVSSLSVLYNFELKPSDLSLFSVGGFKIIVFISLIVIGLFKLFT